MTNLMAQPAFQLYALTSAILVVILYSLGFLTAKRRAERKAVVNHEDVGVNRGATVVEVEHPDVQRIKRAHANLVENAVPFFVIGFLYCLTDPSMMWTRIFFFTFLAVRLFHAIFYLGLHFFLELAEGVHCVGLAFTVQLQARGDQVGAVYTVL